MSSRPLLLALIVALAAAAGAHAARQPTPKERGALTAVLPSLVRSFPAGCEWLEMKVSSTGRWAEVDPWFFATAACHRYEGRYGNGFFILQKTSGRWRIVFRGSDAPPCRLDIPRDITPECVVCRGGFCTYHPSG